MCNFTIQSQETKQLLHVRMQEAVQNIGGVNFLLSLIEAMKTKKPHPLSYRECKISSNNTSISWNKVVFQDKIELLEKHLLLHKNSDDAKINFQKTNNSKQKKALFNMVKALSPIEFTVTPQNPNDGKGFRFKAFECIEEENVTINPVFIAMFFCSSQFTKKALNYSA